MPRILRYTQLAIMIISVCLLITLVGTLVKQEVGTTRVELTVVVDKNTDAYRDLPRLIPGEIQQITPLNSSQHEYRVLVRTKRPLEVLLDALRGSPKVVDAKQN